MATILVDTLATIHTADVDRFVDPCRRRPIGERVDSVIDQLEGATRVTGHDLPALRGVGEWLRDNVPPDSTPALVHGDYRPSNVVFAGDDHPECTGVLDWETAGIGDPLTDVGYLLLRWRDAGDPTPPLAGLRERYSNDPVIRELEEANERGLAPFTSAPGSPTRRELVSRYEAETGRTYEHDRFYRGFSAFALATVWEDLHRHRVEAGGDSEKKPYIEYMSSIATRIVSGDVPL